MITQLDTENGNLNITSEIVCLTHKPSATLPTWCHAVVYLGDDTDGLDTTGGSFTIRANLDSQYGPTRTQTIAAQARATLDVGPFLVPANVTVTIRILSPNGADTDVDITAYLFDVSVVDAIAVSGEVSLADDAITSAKYDESTAFPVKSADTGATAIARVGADGDTLEDLSDEIAAVDASIATGLEVTDVDVRPPITHRRLYGTTL